MNYNPRWNIHNLIDSEDNSVEVFSDRIEVKINSNIIGNFSDDNISFGNTDLSHVIIDDTSVSLYAHTSLYSFTENGLLLPGGGQTVNEFSSDSTFSSSSNTKVPTEQAIKTYTETNFIKVTGEQTTFNISTPQDGDVMTYDSTSQTWINTVNSGGGGITDPYTIGTFTVTEKLVIPLDEPTVLEDGAIWLTSA